MNDARPTRRRSVRARDLDDNELEFIFSISKKLYRCPYCRTPIEVGREHTLVRYLGGPAGTFHQHLHGDCASQKFRRELRAIRSVRP